MGNELSKSVKDQIIADAKMRTGFDENKDHKPYDKGMYHGFVSAACIYTDKAQVLVDALDEIVIALSGINDTVTNDIVRIAEKSLQQFKDGKGKEAICSCSLQQLAAHGECYKCPGQHTRHELTNPQK